MRRAGWIAAAAALAACSSAWTPRVPDQDHDPARFAGAPACGGDSDCRDAGVCRFLSAYLSDGGLPRAVCTPPPPGWANEADPSYPPLPGMR